MPVKKETKTLSLEEQRYRAEVAFDNALSRCQRAIPEIPCDQFNSETETWMQSYGALDAALRPIYLKERFSIGFTDQTQAGSKSLGAAAMLSRGGVNRFYRVEVIIPQPAVGESAFSETYAAMAAWTIAKRLLLIDIFNVPKPAIVQEPVTVMADHFAQCSALPQLREMWRKEIAILRDRGDDAGMARLDAAFEKAKRRILEAEK